MNPEPALPPPADAGPQQPRTDEPSSWLRLLLNLLMIPVALLLLVPLAILVALWFYLTACKEGLRLAFRAMLGRRGEDPAMRVLPAPHFSETREGSAATDIPKSS